LKGHLVSMIKDCQDRVFSAYKASKQMSPRGIQPHDNKEAEASIVPLPNGALGSTFDPGESNSMLLPIYQPLPHQPQRQHGPDLWDIENLNVQFKNAKNSAFSDSGYSTNRLCACSGQCYCSRSTYSLSNGTPNPSILETERSYGFMNPGGNNNFDQGTNGSSSWQSPNPYDSENQDHWWNTP
jgi:hypothetical protein